MVFKSSKKLPSISSSIIVLFYWRTFYYFFYLSAFLVIEIKRILISIYVKC